MAAKWTTRRPLPVCSTCAELLCAGHVGVLEWPAEHVQPLFTYLASLPMTLQSFLGSLRRNFRNRAVPSLEGAPSLSRDL